MNYSSLANLLAIRSWKGPKFTFCPVFKASICNKIIKKKLDSMLVFQEL